MCGMLFHRLQPVMESSTKKCVCTRNEKLDGTNVGVRCDGARFGRRQAITAECYKKCRLEGVIPRSEDVVRIKSKIAKLVSMHLPKLYLYGELMINNKFDYTERALSKNWYCFGAMFDASTTEMKTESTVLVERLRSAGFYTTLSPDNGKIKLSMNTELEALLRDEDILVAPFEGSGPLKLV